MLFNHRVTALEDGDTGVTVTAQTPDGERTFAAKWLIGADGARSTVRKLAGIEFEGHTWPERFVATNVKFDFRKLGYEQANFVCDPVNMAVIALLDRDGLWRCTYMEDSALPRGDLRGPHPPALRMVHARVEGLRDRLVEPLHAPPARRRDAA